ncbi:MAG: phosphomannomutase/phosphoglucomutase [Deltaproteobacteria bacterium]|nr:phosphomannomutase/phosphoglucomutase [Deltaproteobacteria bacterium]
MKPEIFRSYDIRGIADTDLTDEVVTDIGRAFGSALMEAGGAPVVVGRDARLSGPRIHAALLAGLTEVGASVIDLGVVPTPLCYFAANFREAVGGLVMITGSHNPPDHNGLKLGLGRRTMGGEKIQALRQRIEASDFFQPDGPGEVESWDPLPAYLSYLENNLELGPYRPKVVVDAGNGVGGLTAAPILERLGFQMEALYLEPDGTFPNHEADPTVVANLEELCARVISSDADLGVAYDGDADRVGVIDERGEILWGDQLMVIFARSILERRPGATFVAEVKCSQVLYDEIDRLGGNGIMWKAGHTHIKDKMKETGAVAAGEMSGHIFFADRYYGFDDACYATLRLLEILSHTRAPLSELLEGLPETFTTPELRVPCPEEVKFRVVELVRDLLASHRQVVDVDGVRVIHPDGWGLLRASNTQPLLVLRFEAESEARRDAIQAEVTQALQEALTAVAKIESDRLGAGGE